MTTTSVRVLVLGLLMGAFEASAQRISLPDFSGRGAGAVRTQLVNQLCDTADCVAATKVTTGGKPDMKKAKRELLQFFVTGVVAKAKRGKGTSLELSVVAVKGTAKVKRVFPLEKNGTLSSRNLQGAVDLINDAIGTGEPASAPPPTPAPEPTPAPSRSETSSEPTEPTEPSVVERTPEPAPPPPPSRRTSSKPLVFALELGTDILNRSLTYQPVNNTLGVRDYALGAFPTPLAKLEFYPLALVRNDALSGLGVEAAFGYAWFLKSRPKSAEGTTCTANPTSCYDTKAMRFDIALRWRIVVSPSFPLAITPFFGLRVQSFVVDPNSTGSLGGLPNISFVSLRAGLGLEVPVVNNLLYIIGHFGLLPVLSYGEILKKDGPYFTGGSAFGFETSVGLAVQPAKFLQIRGSFEYTQYGLTFKTSANESIKADSATDRYLGGNIAVRLQF